MFGASGGFPIDLVLFGMIAAFLILRLRSILGRRTGFERPPELKAPEVKGPPLKAPGLKGPVLKAPELRRGLFGARQIIEGKAEPVPEPVSSTVRKFPVPGAATAQTIASMRQVDRRFDPARFLDGAEAAFRKIVAAFAAGNRQALRPLLNEDTWRAFDLAITAREEAGEHQRTEIKAMNSVGFESAALNGAVAEITVRFVSDQINATIGRDGQPVAGTDALTEIVDVWTFEKDLSSADPTWRLVAARGG